MEVSELRIGNYFLSTKDKNKEYVVTKASAVIIDYCVCRYIHYKPIQLTEDWLVKFGFKHRLHGAKRGVQKAYQLHGNTFNISNSGNIYYGFKNIPIYSVHQLQNLIFALTGKELVLNDNH